jgi:hypothetical protein
VRLRGIMKFDGNEDKIGEIGLDDRHTVVLFSKDDRKYIQSTYIDKLISYNFMIDEILEELYWQKKEIDKMVFHADNMKQVWSYRHKTKYAAAKFYQNFHRLEVDLNNMLKERATIMKTFHDDAIRFHNDQTVRDNHFSPVDSAEKEDLVTSPGINKAAQQITGETFKRWEFYGLGRSLIPAFVDDSDLKDPISRFYIKSHGSFAALGDVIRLLIISPGDMPTDDIGEVGIFNSQSGPDIFTRAVLGKLIHHDADNHFLCASANLYLVSRR